MCSTTLRRPRLTVLNKNNDITIKSTSICNGKDNTYDFDFGKDITLSGLSFISYGDVQTSESLSMTCAGQYNNTKMIEVILFFFHNPYFYEIF